MIKLAAEAERIMTERFGKDSVIALATTDNGAPQVRFVNAYYEDGAFYIVTHALSGKMKQLAADPAAAIAGEWFTAHGKGACIGSFGSEENRRLAAKLREVFASWIDNGHSDLGDVNTVILRVELTDGVLLSHGTRYEF
ncbi:MAG: pyridoxamine 5'-phosphate oxidase family protein [Oscillospiraceae bacterium]